MNASALTLNDLGWDEGFAASFEPYEKDGLVPARIAAQYRGAYVVLAETGESRADISGRMRHEAASAADLPAVGDWVVLRDETIHAVLPRRSAFSRKAAWAPTEEQVLAANLDAIFVLSALNGDLNLRRLERYLTLAWESGATPVIVLTKADLCDDVGAALLEVEQVALGVAAHAISNVSGAGIDELAPYLALARTVALLGSSGVGKSTLANRLAGEVLQATHEIAEDGRGRHTTSSRQLIRLPGGAMLVDTPGLREVQLWDADEGIAEAFADVDALAAGCRFNDCAHMREPGCAVQAAIGEGRLVGERLQSYRQLQRELERLALKQDARLRSDARKQRAAFARSLRKASW
ncbi:MAG: ribosome small subunit-dependent GTPase A [Actinomycetota bacterium]|nr:ribosome small subunit-dependent GTPase A [Actinomycetota bacterium]